ncbi:hypothetical protein IIZ77_02230 [Candidatus Saccharibacteria bacterium]|nr:hypothetical protein [Candidatus Saccharibacteria bacterium]
MHEEKVSFKKRYPFLSKILLGLLILLLVIGLAFGTWAVVYWAGGTHIAPTLEVFTNPTKVFSQPKVVRQETPAGNNAANEVSNAQVTPEVIYVYVTPVPDGSTAPAEPTAPSAPTAPPANQPTAVVTVAPVTHAAYTLDKEIKVNVEGKEVVFRTFTYSGGYIPADDPWFVPAENKENENSYGAPIYGQTPQELAYNWLRELCKSPHQIIRLRTQMGMIKPKSLEEENKLAAELAAKSAKDYDKVVNETLQFFFKKLQNGRIESSTDWDLENYMLAVTDSGDSGEINLRGRLNHDDDTDPKDKDVLLTFYAKGATKTFVSSDRGYDNTAKDAKVSGSFSKRAWVNMTEGGTWKWKSKGNSSGGSNSNPSSGGDTPTSNPTSAPTSEPTTKPRAAKDPNQRPTVSDAPVGGGSTNPENNTDPQTVSAPVSTPELVNTTTPAPTAEPTAVPTAEVRPTEVCQTTSAPLVREDKTAQPTAEPNHSVPTQEPSTAGDGNNNGDFNPDNI